MSQEAEDPEHRRWQPAGRGGRVDLHADQADGGQHDELDPRHEAAEQVGGHAHPGPQVVVHPQRRCRRGHGRRLVRAGRRRLGLGQAHRADRFTWLPAF
jgi:hypothetical protein